MTTPSLTHCAKLTIRIGRVWAAVCIGCGAVGAEVPSSWDLEMREVWRFPPAMQVADVRREFGAVGDGQADDTAALQKAIDRNGAFVYIPNGTYLVRDGLRYNGRPGIGPTIQGESRDGVIIRLADDASGFDDPARPKAVIQLIRGAPRDRISADYFKTRLRNLTIDAGAHRGAIGLVFYANNNGMCRNVRLAGRGVIGLDLAWPLNGPLLVSNIEVEGFGVGINAGSGPFNSQTLEHVLLHGQHRYGLYNDGESLSIRDVRSRNAVPALWTTGNTVLLDSDLAGGAANAPAIVCGGPQVFLRNLNTAGYGLAIERRVRERKAGLTAVEERVPAGHVQEWTSGVAVRSFEGDAPAVRTLGLPIEEAPYLPLDRDPAQWLCVDSYGAVPDDATDDSDAVRKALDAAAAGGRSTVCFRHGQYILGGRFEIRGAVARLQGAGTLIQPAPTQEVEIAVLEGTAPVVLFDLIDRVLGPKRVVRVNNASARTLVLRGLRCTLRASGPGKTFLEDAGSLISVDNPGARVWARQLNSESATGVNNENHGGMLWVLGLKTEKDRTVLAATGGRTEVLGGWVYVIGREAPLVPMFTVRDAAFSAAGILQYHSAGRIYPVIVDETQGVEHRQLTKATNYDRGSIAVFRSKK